MALTSVDLPAPLSPTRATTSCERTSKSMPLRAWTAPKRFEIPRNDSTAVRVGVGGGEVVAVMRVLGSGRSDTGEGGTGRARARRNGWGAVALGGGGHRTGWVGSWPTHPVYTRAV